MTNLINSDKIYIMIICYFVRNVMPDFWSHLVIGEKVINIINIKRITNACTHYPNVFNLSCQGPDLLLCHKFWPWIKDKPGHKLGVLLHNEGIKKAFSTAFKYVKSSDDDILLTYMTGYICHYVFDYTAHPFVIKRTDTYPLHKALELALDTAIMSREGRYAYKENPWKAAAIKDGLPKCIEDFYNTIFNAVYDITPLQNIYRESYKDLKTIWMLFYSPSGIKRNLIKILNPLFPINAMVYFHPKKTPSSVINNNDVMEFIALFEQSINKAANLITAFNSYLNDDMTIDTLMENINDINYKGEIDPNKH